MLRVCVWGADSAAQQAYCAALSTALQTAGANAVVCREPDADLHFLLGLNPGNAAAERAIDASLRDQLQRFNAAYTVLYGAPADQMSKAMAIIGRHAQPPSRATNTDDSAQGVVPWVWPCDKCGDASCEFRLLTGLLSQRSPASSRPA